MTRTSCSLFLALFACASLTVACGDDDSPADSGSTNLDSSTGRDSGNDNDTGADEDSSTPEDSATPEDGGSAEDSGGDPDTGAPVDGGGDDTGATDAGSGEMCPDLAPTSGETELIISQVQFLGTGVKIELFNPTGSAITDSTYQFCQFGSAPSYVPVGSLNVGPGEYVEITVENFGENLTNNEVVLYREAGNFQARTNMVDYLCWGGSGAATARKSFAEMSPALWSGNCVESPTGDTIARRASTDGTIRRRLRYCRHVSNAFL